jgi:signal transduction histidine kinase
MLEVADDGRGVDPDDAARAKAGGHMGLTILSDLVRDGGGELTVVPGPQGGTVVRVEMAER